MTHFTPVFSAIGGALIGVSASVLLAFTGRIAGISGIFGGAIVPRANDTAWRIWFLAGLISAGVVWRFVSPASFGAPIAQPLGLTIFAGLLVGAGTQIGNGCTSGHGVCGISRGSKRSIAATLIFMTTAAVTVLVVRHVAGGS